MTNGSDFAFNDSATRLQAATPEGIEAHNPPLTKREYFAAMALQGILVNNSKSYTSERLANDAVDAADALINALNEKP
jgi:hypothetical protein